MSFFRQNIAPFLILLVFLIALVAVSARIFLPTDLATPAPNAGFITPVASYSFSVWERRKGEMRHLSFTLSPFCQQQAEV